MMGGKTTHYIQIIAVPLPNHTQARRRWQDQESREGTLPVIHAGSVKEDFS